MASPYRDPMNAEDNRPPMTQVELEAIKARADNWTARTITLAVLAVIVLFTVWLTRCDSAAAARNAREAAEAGVRAEECERQLAEHQLHRATRGE